MKHLKQGIQEDPSVPGVSPVTILSIRRCFKRIFLKQLKDSYQYEMLGGQHTVAAKTELLKN